MKREISKTVVILTLLAMITGLSACETRPIPGDKLITLYNSDLEATGKIAPLDTLYVRVSGMESEEYYRVSVTDTDGNVISEIEAKTDGDGVIETTPLWYDVALKKPDTLHPLPWIDTSGDLSVISFFVRVESLENTSTDFKQAMFLVTNPSNINTKPKPIVYACYHNSADSTFYLENAFEESGSLKADGTASDKTKIYVQAERLPFYLGNNQTNEVTEVDVYIMPFTGNMFADGDLLSTGYAARQTGVPVTTSADGFTKVLNAAAASPVWDLNDPVNRVTNPTQDTMAYSVVLDVDRDGTFDAGVDTTGDGLADVYVDGVDGNGVPGFIIQNTPANDVRITIKDEAGTIVNSIVENQAKDTKHLYFNMENVPVGSGDTVRVYLVAGNAAPADGAALADERNGVTGQQATASAPAAGSLRFLPYIENARLLNTDRTTPDQWTDNDDVTADKNLNLIVDTDDDGNFDSAGDIFHKDAVTILYVPANPSYATYSDSAANNAAQFFNETNAETLTTVYLKGINSAAQYDVHIVKDRPWNNGDAVTGQLFSLKGLTGDGPTKIWDLNGAHQVINPDISENTYNILIDNNHDGIYDYTNDGDPSNDDDLLTIVILNTNVNSYPRLTYVNIASGGSFGNTYAQHWTLYSEYCDYRDTFTANGQDTNRAGGGYGIKAVFNPYFKWFSNPNPEKTVAGLYYGKSVDVYIVDATTFDLADYGHAGELNDTVDVTGRHSTIPVQPSCYNGAGMKTIWPAAMKPGKYYVIVDVNQNGIIDEGTDIIDAVNKNDETILDNGGIVGFTVQ